MVLVGQKWLFPGKSGCRWAKVVVFWQKWLISIKNGFNSGKNVVFGQGCYIRAKVVLFGPSG